MESKAELESLAGKLNPVIGYWDPLNLADYDQWSQGQEAAIGFLRHAEIKHGRVAMAAFVGYIVQSNGICWPWALTGGPNGVMHSDILAAGEKHYMRGGKPGFFPSIKKGGIPHPVPFDLFD